LHPRGIRVHYLAEKGEQGIFKIEPLRDEKASGEGGT